MNDKGLSGQEIVVAIVLGSMFGGFVGFVLGTQGWIVGTVTTATSAGGWVLGAIAGSAYLMYRRLQERQKECSMCTSQQYTGGLCKYHFERSLENGGASS